MKNVFIIGSKGIPANYGGFETFVEYLTEKKISNDIQYHVSCLSNENSEFNYNNTRCFNVKVPSLGSSRAVLYDLLSIKECINYIRKNNLDDCIIYILACRIGPFMSYFNKDLKKLKVKIFINPDGHEWKRSKWNFFIRKYWRYSERLMIKNSDLLICDSKGIEAYIKKDYRKYSPNTKFIAYGADLKQSELKNDDQLLLNWYESHKVNSKEYYLIVGRFVPENNYDLMIKEFIKSDSSKDLVIISNVQENVFYNELLKSTNFSKDMRIKFVGTVYNQELLKKIRENAYGYLHGHEVGGTNPSLLESLASTDLNLLLDVVFNREVGDNGALYFTKERGNLVQLIDKVDNFNENEINSLSNKAKERIAEAYSWEKIVNEYEFLFLNN
ncbi:beta 1-4 rhamnosyltransferase Cps2T [Jeotgalibacillus campisalis]|uniref:Glycosyl transferase n=1 Tax=Jeotgalibacillus campisalis TaxID=220754 RepID=A0A0C2RN08_9BACL|nr:DUF1972 domain-containing protein [Jeotgalibacillus campisalis]KIL43159.1 glycosyl transferase [Jeotgalibacillus campisalis]